MTISVLFNSNNYTSGRQDYRLLTFIFHKNFPSQVIVSKSEDSVGLLLSPSLFFNNKVLDAVLEQFVIFYIRGIPVCPQPNSLRTSVVTVSLKQDTRIKLELFLS